MYSGCLIIWASKIQYLIVLSITESEYTELATAFCEVIGIFNILEELKGNGFNVHTNNTKATCHTFEVNKICIGIDTNHRTRLEQNICM